MIYVVVTVVCLLGIVGVLPIPLPWLAVGTIVVLGGKAFLSSK